MDGAMMGEGFSTPPPEPKWEARSYNPDRQKVVTKTRRDRIESLIKYAWVITLLPLAVLLGMLEGRRMIKNGEMLKAARHH